MAKIVTLGEIMLRLKSPAFERLFQSSTLEATFGGGEANVAVSLSVLGMDSSYVTVVPENPVGQACVNELRKYGVDTNQIIRKKRWSSWNIFFRSWFLQPSFCCCL